MSFAKISITALGLSLLSLNAIGQHSLTVRIDNIKKNVGKITMSIFSNAAAHLKNGKAYKTVTFLVKNPVEHFTFNSLPPGDYSVVLFQDINNDGQCNRNMIGIPTEPYAFSKNFKPKVSAPSFDETKISLRNSQTIRISLIH